MNLTEAILIAAGAHHGQRDKQGEPLPMGNFSYLVLGHHIRPIG